MELYHFTNVVNLAQIIRDGEIRPHLDPHLADSGDETLRRKCVWLTTKETTPCGDQTHS